MNKLENIGQHLLPVIAYGDSAGLPFETMSAAEIASEYGRVRRLNPTNINSYFPTESGSGTWSDDTQLSIAVTEGLLIDEFNLSHIALAHIKQYELAPKMTKNGRPYPKGWGGSTVGSVEKIMQGVDPSLSGSLSASGNGVIMKFASLALWQAAKNIPDSLRYEQGDALTKMTHNTPVATVCTRVHSDVLQFLLQHEKTDDLPAAIMDFTRQHERDIEESGTVVSEKLNFLIKHKLTPKVILQETDGKGFYVPETLAITYGNFLLNVGNFVEVIYGAVNLGGDTDSIASISGTMELFLSGAIKRPRDMHKLKSLDRLEKLSTAFTAAIITKGEHHGNA